MEIWRLPPVMIVHLKRFRHFRGTTRKVNSLVDFPLQGLDMTPFLAGRGGAQKGGAQKGGAGAGAHSGISGISARGAGAPRPECTALPRAETSVCRHAALEPRYDLFAVVSHIGQMGSGHYVAHAKSPVDGRWRFFNDRFVRPADPREAITRNAYLLFYRRRDLEGLRVGDLFPPDLSRPPVEVAEDRAEGDAGCTVA
jgi:ubiquitin carboxyl-terminal hydrolase 4/11/15